MLAYKGLLGGPGLHFRLEKRTQCQGQEAAQGECEHEQGCSKPDRLGPKLAAPPPTG